MFTDLLFVPQGIYTCLFIAALPMLINAKRRQDANNRNTAWVSVVVNFWVADIMWVLTIMHCSTLSPNTGVPNVLHPDVRGGDHSFR